MSDMNTLPKGILTSQHRGVRVWWITAPDLQGTVDRLAVVLGEHLRDSDELHVSYNGMQTGWLETSKPKLFRPPAQSIDLDFEYSTLVVLRDRAPSAEPEGG